MSKESATHSFLVNHKLEGVYLVDDKHYLSQRELWNEVVVGAWNVLTDRLYGLSIGRRSKEV